MEDISFVISDVVHLGRVNGRQLRTSSQAEGTSPIRSMERDAEGGALSSVLEIPGGMGGLASFDGGGLVNAKGVTDEVVNFRSLEGEAGTRAQYFMERHHYGP